MTRRPVQLGALPPDLQDRACARLRARGALAEPRQQPRVDAEGRPLLWCGHPASTGEGGNVVRLFDGFERTRRGAVKHDDDGAPVEVEVEVCEACSVEALLDGHRVNRAGEVVDDRGRRTVRGV